MFNINHLQKILSRFSPVFSKLFSAKSLFSIILFASLFSVSPLSTFADSFTDIQEAVVGIAVLVVHFVVYITWVVIGMMGDLLGNDAVMHPNVIPILKLLWTMMRNFINMAAVFWLLYIAFKTLFTSFSGVDTGEIGKNLGKLAMALVVVNFSWLAVVVVIDASSVATHYAFLLSDVVKGGTTFNGLCKSDSSGTENCMQSVYSIKYNTEVTAKGQSDIDANLNGWKGKTDIANAIFKVPYTKDLIGLTGDVDVTKFKGNEQRIAKLNGISTGNNLNYKCFKSGSTTEIETTGCDLERYLEYRHKTAAIVLVLKPLTADMSEISNRTLVAMIAQNILPLEEFLTRAKSAGSVGTVFLQIFTSVLLSLMMLIAFISLAVVLFVRVAVLWLALMGSPLIALLFLDDDAFGLKEWFFKVVHLAFVPAYFGVVFSLTFVILGQMSYNGTSVIGFSGGKPIILENGIMQTGTPMFNLMLSLMVLVLFWMAVFWALNKADITGKIVSSIQGTAQGWAGWLAKRPLYMNIVPMGTRADGSAVMGDLKSTLDSINKVRSDAGHKNDWEEYAASQIKDTKVRSEIAGAKRSDVDVSIDIDKLNLANPKDRETFINALPTDKYKNTLAMEQGPARNNALVQLHNQMKTVKYTETERRATLDAMGKGSSTGGETNLSRSVTKQFSKAKDLSANKDGLIEAFQKIGVETSKEIKPNWEEFVGKLNLINPSANLNKDQTNKIIEWLKDNKRTTDEKKQIKEYLETGK